MDRKEYKALWYQKNKERISLERKLKYKYITPLSEEEKNNARKVSWRKHNQTPLAKYRFQQNAARRRGIEWEFTFDSWWKVWEDSGKWDERGQLAHQFCMCRIKDRGPYSPNNVYIDTTSSNAKEVRMLNKQRK